jgi:hypothetical protein
MQKGCTEEKPFRFYAVSSLSFSTFIIYSLAPCPLLLAPYETEQAELAKVEYLKR